MGLGPPPAPTHLRRRGEGVGGGSPSYVPNQSNGQPQRGIMHDYDSMSGVIKDTMGERTCDNHPWAAG